MSTSKEFAEYVTDQLGGEGEVLCKKLFGEYGLWRGGKLFGTIERDELYVKITEAGTCMLPGAVPVAPHGGKPGMYLVEELEDRDFLRELMIRTTELLPAPKPKKRKEIHKGR